MAKHAANANLISQIKIPAAISGLANDMIYDIHDPSAIHEIADLGLSTVLDFKGVVKKYTDLPSENNKIGDVYHVTDEDYEYVWIDSNGDDIGDTWEEFGAAHDFIGTGVFNSHTHALTAQPTVTIPSLDASGTVSIKKYKPTTTKLKAEVNTATLTGSDNKTVLTNSTTFTTDTVTTNVTHNTDTIEASVSQASWGATVDSNGVLTFTWIPNNKLNIKKTVVTSISTTTDNVNVTHSGGTASIPATWSAGAQTVSLKTGTTGTTIATGIEEDGTEDVSATLKTTAQTVSTEGGTIGTPV